MKGGKKMTEQKNYLVVIKRNDIVLDCLEVRAYNENDAKEDAIQLLDIAVKEVFAG